MSGGSAILALPQIGYDEEPMDRNEMLKAQYRRMKDSGMSDDEIYEALPELRDLNKNKPSVDMLKKAANKPMRTE